MNASTEHLESARILRESGSRVAARSIVSRCYFSAYAAMHALLFNAGLEPPSGSAGEAGGGNHWTHAKIAGSIDGMLDRLVRRNSDRARLKSSYRRLRGHRVEADYKPGHTIDEEVVRRALVTSSELHRLAVRAIAS